MDKYYIYYAVTNFFGLVVFGIMLGHNLANIDRQEKQIKYDRALCAFMLYFLNDSIWVHVDAGVIQASRFAVTLLTYANYLFMTAITYFWLQFALAVEQYPNRNRPLNRFAMVFPFFVSSIALTITTIVSPLSIIDGALHLTGIYNIFLTVVPCIYILAVVFYAIRRAVSAESRFARKTHIYIALFPLCVVIGGMIQMLFMPNLPLFCYSSTILMLIFYIQTINDQISTDPLTQLNNRGELSRYVSQSGNLRLEGKSTFVVMIDVNDFKLVNDTYGHAEGDAALLIIARSLVSAGKAHDLPVFMGRYGGDEFVLIVYPSKQEELESFLGDIRSIISEECSRANKPYDLSIGIGFDEFLGGSDSFDKCLQRADSKLYLDKEYCKINGKSTMIQEP